MKDFLMMALGASVGAIAGAGLGILLGLVYVEIVHASCFEGACGFAVAGCFLPLGGLVGLAGGPSPSGAGATGSVFQKSLFSFPEAPPILRHKL